MSRLDPNQGITPSLLDRLIDPESSGTSWRRGYGIAEMIASVHRDLEELLNTRQSHVGLPEDFAEVERSIVGYGLPDLAGLNAATPQQREETGRMASGLGTRPERCYTGKAGNRQSASGNRQGV